MNTYELKHIRGIPYYLNGATVYTFELDTTGKAGPRSTSIGTYDPSSDTITYFSNWRERTKSNLELFRSSITIQQRDKLRETICKPQKQRKSTRAPRKSTRAKNTKSE